MFVVFFFKTTIPIRQKKKLDQKLEKVAECFAMTGAAGTIVNSDLLQNIVKHN